MRKVTRATLLAILIAASSATGVRAGEYGLTVSDQLASPCGRGLSLHLNQCRADAVAADLRRYFVEAKELEIAAVRMAILHGAISVPGKLEKQILWESLVKLVVVPTIHHEQELLDFVCRLPYRTLREAFNAEVRKGGHPERIRVRLEKVVECHRGGR